uniref:GTP binding protein overexpressed in skeletal muscle n=1 Tax=Canis lupus familiaris TaxID=9615 RepID=A0A8C0P714_CANLF
MTLNNVTMRQGPVGMQPQQQRWSIPADGRHLMVQKEPPQYGQHHCQSAAPEDPCRRSWSSDSTDSVISSESGNTYYRVVLIGEQGVGKSTLANIFAGVHDSMDSDCEVLGEDTYERTLIVDGESATIILLDMWENKGENEWLQDHCMQVGDAYLIVYSITDRASFEKASELRIQLRRARQAEDIPIILVGNKSDLVRCREVSVSAGAREMPRGASWGRLQRSPQILSVPMAAPSSFWPMCRIPLSPPWNSVREKSMLGSGEGGDLLALPNLFSLSFSLGNSLEFRERNVRWEL